MKRAIVLVLAGLCVLLSSAAVPASGASIGIQEYGMCADGEAYAFDGNGEHVKQIAVCALWSEHAIGLPDDPANPPPINTGPGGYGLSFTYTECDVVGGNTWTNCSYTNEGFAPADFTMYVDPVAAEGTLDVDTIRCGPVHIDVSSGQNPPDTSGFGVPGVWRDIEFGTATGCDTTFDDWSGQFGWRPVDSTGP